MLRSGELERINKLISQLGAEIRGLIQTCLELAWYSRGAWDYHTTLQMTAAERDIANEFISKRLELEAKKHYPVY
jgi:hypothetical protein